MNFWNKAGGVVFWVTVAAMSQADTVVWTNASGGYWADAANWQDGTVPDAYSNAVDFSALGSGAAVTLTNTTSAGSLYFSGSSGDEWTLDAVNSAGLNVGKSVTDPVAHPATITVAGGVLTLGASLALGTDGLVKTGDGALRLTAANTFSGLTVLEDGTLFLSNGTTLVNSSLVFASSSAALVLESDAQVGGFETRCVPPPELDLGGHTLTVGGETADRAFGGKLANGALIVACGESPTFTATQEVSSVRLENGSLNLGVDVKIAGWWRFNDASQVGKDSGPRTNDLVQSGSQTQWLTDDPERGSVLSLDGAGAYLAGPDGGNVAGLPVSNMPFTVAFWFKPSASVDNTAGIYAWGVSGISFCYNMTRLNTPSSSLPLMQTNWGNNHNIAFAPGLMDGAWHHLAIVYRGSLYQYYIDGEFADAYIQSTPLTVNAGNFVLGKGWSSTTFKGLMDDVFIARGALDYGQIRELCENGRTPSEKGSENLLPETAQVEIAYNGELRLAGDQTLAALEGAGAAGGVELVSGATLTLAGPGAAATNLCMASVSGDGAIVKRGADYTLTLGGRVGTTGVTEVLEGTLALAGRLPSGLQAYYRFDDAANLGKDSSGHGYDLTPSNSPAFVTGLFGGAASFAAADKDCFVSTVFPATVPTGNQSYTLSVWCNLLERGNSVGLPVYWGKGNNTQGGSALFRFNSPTQIMTSNMGNNWTVDVGYDLSSDVPDGGWHHIACTYDGATRERRVFIDGFQKGGNSTNAWDLSIDGQTFWIGGAPYSTGNYYDGLLDEVMIFNRALSATEIADVMTGVFSAPWASRLTEQVAAHYRFEDASDPGKDSGPYGYDLSAVGAVSLTDGKVGQALNLWGGTGSAQRYLSWTNSFFPEALPTGNAPVTVTAWVNPRTGANSEGSIAFWGSITPGVKSCHLLRIATGSNGQLAFRLVDGVGYIGSEDLNRPDRGNGPEGWHHVAAVVAPGGLRAFYVDGARVSMDRVTGQAVASGTFSIGYKPTAATAWFEGLIDEVTVYKCALSQAEILEALRGGPDIFAPDSSIDVAAGAVWDTGDAIQCVAGFTGAGEVKLGGGTLTVKGGTCVFNGALTGEGDLAVRDGAALTLTGTNTFAGSVVVSNATLLVANADGAATGAGSSVTVQSDGVLGGTGAIAGDLIFEDGASLAAGDGTDRLTVTGTLTLGATGTVSAASGLPGGRYPLISAAAVSAPSGFSGWTVTPAPEHWQTALYVQDGVLTLKLFRSGTLLSVQ